MSGCLFALWVALSIPWAVFFGLSRNAAAANPDLYDDDARQWHARMALAAPIWPLVVAWFVLGALGKHVGYIVRDATVQPDRQQQRDSSTG